MVTRQEALKFRWKRASRSRVELYNFGLLHKHIYLIRYEIRAHCHVPGVSLFRDLCVQMSITQAESIIRSRGKSSYWNRDPGLFRGVFLCRACLWRCQDCLEICPFFFFLFHLLKGMPFTHTDSLTWSWASILLSLVLNMNKQVKYRLAHALWSVSHIPCKGWGNKQRINILFLRD